MNLAQFFHNADTESRPVLIIPKLSEMRVDAYRADLRQKIDAQLETAARQLATANFYRWDRRMISPAIERWDADQLRFIGLDLSDFCRAIEATFRVCTEDGQEWRLDRCIGSRLWEKCCAPGLLPEASFDIELAKRRVAEKGNGKTCR
jgi:hypothetical protein